MDFILHYKIWKISNFSLEPYVELKAWKTAGSLVHMSSGYYENFMYFQLLPVS